MNLGRKRPNKNELLHTILFVFICGLGRLILYLIR